MFFGSQILIFYAVGLQIRQNISLVVSRQRGLQATIYTNKTNVPADLQSAGIEYKDLQSLVFERLFYSGYVAMAKIRFTEFLPSAGCHHSVCPHYRHLARP